MRADDEPPVAGPRRRPWLIVLRFALPWVLGLVILLCAIAWGLRQTASSDVRAVAGALGIWVGEISALVAYMCWRHSLLRHPNGFWPRVRPTLVKRGRLFVVASYVSPGLWIGWTAQNPLAAVVATRLATQVVLFLNNLRMPAVERDRINWRRFPKRV